MTRALAMLVAAVALAGCAERLDAPLSPAFGKAVASLDAQIVPPDPSDGPADSSASRGVAAVRRYEKGQPKPLEAAATTPQGGTYESHAETPK
jgi:hypothetical protein